MDAPTFKRILKDELQKDLNDRIVKNARRAADWSEYQRGRGGIDAVAETIDKVDEIWKKAQNKDQSEGE